MTVAEFFKFHCRSELKIMSGYNGKILCKSFNPNKHESIGQREVSSVWAEIKPKKGTFGNVAEPIICAYVDGHEEYKKERGAE